MALDDLWESWRSPEGEILRTFVIITVPASPDVAELHDRMPLIVEEGDWPAWLGEAQSDPTALLRSSSAGVLRTWSVSRAVNSPQNNEPQLLDLARVGSGCCSHQGGSGTMLV
jgi:putative SOS response-associated peptidase YedK